VFVVMTHNTDISDAWEREGEDPRYFYQFSPKGYGVGIDVIVCSSCLFFRPTLVGRRLCGVPMI
jgi:hypothetical protein